MEPFKWDYIEVDRAKLGKAAALLTNCLESREFWSNLKRFHQKLMLKYAISYQSLSYEFKRDIELL